MSGRTAAILVPVAVVARGAAFVVPLLVAAWYGAGPVADAWAWALAFPTVLVVAPIARRLVARLTA